MTWFLIKKSSFFPLRLTTLLFLLVLTTSCFQVNNSASNDKQEFGEQGQIDTSTPEGQRLSRAVTIFRTQCLSCHPGAGQLTLDYTSDAEFIDSERVIPGDASSSLLFRSLQGDGVALMPPGGSLTETEINDIRDWIDEMP